MYDSIKNIIEVYDDKIEQLYIKRNEEIIRYLKDYLYNYIEKPIIYIPTNEMGDIAFTSSYTKYLPRLDFLSYNVNTNYVFSLENGEESILRELYKFFRFPTAEDWSS